MKVLLGLMEPTAQSQDMLLSPSNPKGHAKVINGSFVLTAGSFKAYGTLNFQLESAFYSRDFSPDSCGVRGHRKDSPRIP